MVLDGIRWMAIDILDETGDDLISTVLDALLPVDMDEGHSVGQSLDLSLFDDPDRELELIVLDSLSLDGCNYSFGQVVRILPSTPPYYLQVYNLQDWGSGGDGLP